MTILIAVDYLRADVDVELYLFLAARLPEALDLVGRFRRRGGRDLALRYARWELSARSFEMLSGLWVVTRRLPRQCLASHTGLE